MNNTIDLQNTRIAFQHKSNSDLKRSYLVFKILQKPYVLRVLKAGANGIIRYRLPFKFFIKKTIFKLFCAGETLDEAFQQIKKINQFKVAAVLDYVSESEKTEAIFKSNTGTIVTNIKRLGKECPNNYVSVKITGLEDSVFLAACNANHFPTDEKSKLRFEKLYNRIDLICLTAKENNVVVYIDAEDRFMQDIIDAMVENMMEKYNTEKAVVFNTLQMYLKDRMEYLHKLIASGKQKQYIAGIKLVRGAYLEKERETALKEKKESPVFDTKEQTDQSFNTAVELCLSNHKNVSTCIASHNYVSTQLAIDCIKKYQIKDIENKVRFSQLYGMCDSLTFNLASGNYNVSKYLPYGEIKKAIPYLIRRSEENSSVNAQIVDELKKIKTELNNRKK
ncbi:MAG: proline dehydrogenase family protein [Bacteroidetes bacterium]|nr:proline dehydrogenase family protein [Bacteroidota bacterium]